MTCTSCPSHFMLDGGLCMECLGSQFYDPPTQLCKTCHESCRSCSGPGQYSCVTCAFPLHLDRLNNQCVPCCSTDASPDDQSCCHCDKDTGKLALPPHTVHHFEANNILCVETCGWPSRTILKLCNTIDVVARRCS